MPAPDGIRSEMTLRPSAAVAASRKPDRERVDFIPRIVPNGRTHRRWVAHEVDAWPLHLAHQRSPIRLGVPAQSGLGTGTSESPLLQRFVAELIRQWPAQPCRFRSIQIILDRTARDAELPGDRPIAGLGAKTHAQHLSYPPHGQPLCWYPPLHRSRWSGVEARSMLTRRA